MREMTKRSKSVAVFGLILCLAMVAACAGPQAIVPTITPIPTGTYHVGKFVWFDLLANDVPGTKRFYGQLFNWEFVGESSGGSNYATIKKDGDPAEGDLAIGKWMWNELWTNDVDASIAFYMTLAGLKHEIIDLSMGEKYTQLKQAGRTRAGVVPIPWEDVAPQLVALPCGIRYFSHHFACENSWRNRGH